MSELLIYVVGFVGGVAATILYNRSKEMKEVEA
jgi:hypothetical protein